MVTSESAESEHQHHRHREYVPHREYLSTDVQPVAPDTVYAVDIEIWPTNVVVEKGGCIVLEVSSGDTQGCGTFQHKSEIDRLVLPLLIIFDITVSNRFIQAFQYFCWGEPYPFWQDSRELCSFAYHPSKSCLISPEKRCATGLVVYRNQLTDFNSSWSWDYAPRICRE